MKNGAAMDRRQAGDVDHNTQSAKGRIYRGPGKTNERGKKIQRTNE
jgi:hypothetical protein